MCKRDVEEVDEAFGQSKGCCSFLSETKYTRISVPNVAPEVVGLS